jgi:2-C-methyl-D-erythritol 4-phosphate cytidylyltransferase
MRSRAMIIVGAGASTRFGRDKLLIPLARLPLVAHSINTIRPIVDRCVLVHREDQHQRLASLRLDVDLVVGGATRTASERAGLDALEDEYDLIGIHDAARPLVSANLIEALFETAERFGGAIPVVRPDAPIVDRTTLQPVDGVGAAQTPQVFRSDILRKAFELAPDDGLEGHDTADLVQRYSDCSIAAVRGEPANVKVTYPEDTVLVEELLRRRS